MIIILFLFCIGLFIWILKLNKTIEAIKHNVTYLLYNQKNNTSKNIKINNSSTKKTNNNPEEDENFPWEKTKKDVLQKTHKIKEKIHTKKSEFHLEEFLGGKFFAILGIVSIVFAIGFFTTWAFSNDLIGPSGRIAIGILFSLIILGIGEYLRPKYPNFSPVILSAGIAGLIITTFVARNFYEFLTANQSFIAYIIEIATGLVLALKNNSRILGNFSIIGGLLSPILINSPDANAIGLLSFLSILSVAGFIISTQKKWSEIIGILFLGILFFEIGILNQNLLKDSPIIFLGFIFGLHLLFGSGGIIRCVLGKIENKISKISINDVFDILIFVISIFTANFLAALIFEQQEWKHLGFFVLFQGFLLWGLSEYLKSKTIEIFQKITLGATMVSIVFATIWEIGTENEVLLSILLSLEGILFYFAGKNLQEKLFLFFGRLTIFISFLFFVLLLFVQTFGKDIGNIPIAIVSLIIAFFYSINTTSKKITNLIWNAFSIVAISVLILWLNFEEFSRNISNKFEFLLYIIPLIWGILLSYSLIKTKKIAGSIFGVLFLILLNFIAFNSYDNYQTNISNWILLILILSSNFTALTAFFIKDNTIKISEITKKIITILILGISTFSIFVFGSEILFEPLRTIFWLFWGGLLFGVGNANNWARFRYFGIGIFCFIIAKLYLIDIWDLDTWVRFLAFFSLGIVLLYVSFLYQKKGNKK